MVVMVVKGGEGYVSVVGNGGGGDGKGVSARVFLLTVVAFMLVSRTVVGAAAFGALV